MWIEIEQYVVNRSKLQGFTYNSKDKNILVLLTDAIFYVQHNINLNDALIYYQFINELYDLKMHFFEHSCVIFDNLSNLTIINNAVYTTRNIDQHILLGDSKSLPTDLITYYNMEI